MVKKIENRAADLDGLHINDLDPRTKLGAKLDQAKQDVEEGVGNYNRHTIRGTLLKRIQKNQERGLFSSEEQTFWRNKLNENWQSIDKIRTEIDEHEKKANQLKAQFDQYVHSAEEEGFLRRGEHETLDDDFSHSNLEKKQQMLKELEKEIGSRREEIGKFIDKETRGLDKSIQKKWEKDLKESEFFEEKLKLTAEYREKSENFKAYQGKADQYKGKIGEKTLKEDFLYFMDQSPNEQLKLIAKADDPKENGLALRAKLWDIHDTLPKKYQVSGFLRMGRRKRLNALESIQHKVDTDYRNTLRKKASGVFCEASIKECQNAFNNLGKDPESLEMKITFLEGLPKAIKAEEKLWKELEKFPGKVAQWLEERFSQATFEEKRKILATAAMNMAQTYKNGMSFLNKVASDSPHIAEAYRSKVENATSPDKLAELMDEVKAFQKSKKNYFDLWKTNQDLFSSDIAVYEKWYEENIDTLEDARAFEGKLKQMIQKRRPIYNMIKGFPPHIQARIDMKAPFAEREKQAQKQKKAADAQSTIQYLVKDGEAKEKDGDEPGALKAYMEALKLDPEDKTLQKVAARLKQKGVAFEGTGANATEQEKIDQLLETLDQTPNISNEIADQALHQLLYERTLENAQTVGASSAGTLQERSRRSLKMQKTTKEQDEMGEAIIDELGDEIAIGDDGKLRKTMRLKTSGPQTKETEDALGALIDSRALASSEGNGGLSEIRFEGRDGQEKTLEAVRREQQAEREKTVDAYMKAVLAAAKVSGQFTKGQLKKLKTLVDPKEHLKKRRQEEIERLQR